MQTATKDQLCTTFSTDNPPVLRVQPGETFVMETWDDSLTDPFPWDLVPSYFRLHWNMMTDLCGHPANG